MHMWKTAAVCGLVGGLFTIGCADASRSSSPTAPSAVTTSDAIAAATIAGAQPATPSGGNGHGGGNNGNGNGNGGGNNGGGNNGGGNNAGGNGNGGNGNGGHNGGGGNGNGGGNNVANPPGQHGNPHQQPSNQTPNVPHNPNTGVAQVEGLITAIAGSSITVRDHVIAVPAGTTIRHGSKHYDFDDLHVGDRVHVTAQIVSGGLEAREVKLQEEITPAVTVAAIDAGAAEVGPETGAFRITRVASASVPLDAPLTVTFTLSGSADSGVDYQDIVESVTLAAGALTADVVITPIADAANEDDETVTLTLADVAPAVIGSPSSATVTIADAPMVLPVVTVAAVDPSGTEAGFNPGIFQFTRSGSTDDALTITFELTGTASQGVDYLDIPVTVTFLDGDANAYVVIRPVLDAIAEGSETVILTVTDGDDYDVDTPETATATITIAG